VKIGNRVKKIKREDFVHKGNYSILWDNFPGMGISVGLK